MTLQALRDKVAAGRVRDWGFEELGDNEDHALDAFHGSLDAAKALHEALLPDHEWQVDSGPSATVYRFLDGGPVQFTAEDDNHARAWLLAVLDALIQEAGE